MEKKTIEELIEQGYTQIGYDANNKIGIFHNETTKNTKKKKQKKTKTYQNGKMTKNGDKMTKKHIATKIIITDNVDDFIEKLCIHGACGYTVFYK